MNELLKQLDHAKAELCGARERIIAAHTLACVHSPLAALLLTPLIGELNRVENVVGSVAGCLEDGS